MQNIKLSIIIISYNTATLLKECLRSLTEFPIDGIEIFVVDNNSQDFSAAIVESDFPMVNLIRNTQNVGFAKANNQAIEKSHGEYVMLLNSDTVMLEGTIEKIIAFMEANPDVGVVGCKLLNTDRTLQPSVTSFPNAIKDTIAIALKGSFLSNNPSSRKWVSKIAKFIGVNASRFDDHSKIKEIDFPRGACMTVRRSILDQVGLFDPEYFFTGEEMDFCYRIKKKGWKIIYYPDAAVIHHDHGASRHMMGKVFVQTRKSALLFYEKHYSFFHTLMMKLSVSIVLMIQCFFLSLRIPFLKDQQKTLLAQRESFWAVVRLHFDSQFRRQNVFSEMYFKYQ